MHGRLRCESGRRRTAATQSRWPRNAYGTLPPDVRAALPPEELLTSALDATIRAGGEQRRVIDLMVTSGDVTAEAQ